MSYSHKYNDRRCCRHYQHVTESSGMSSEYTDSDFTSETMKEGFGNHNIPHKSKRYSKESRIHNSNNEIEPHRSHNAKCPVYVHNMKMQKRYSQNDTYQNPRQFRNQTDVVYNCSKWDYYDDRSHYMKDKFDKLTLDNEYDQKPHKSDCTRKPCPVHHCSNTAEKSIKKRSSPTKNDQKPIEEDVINKLEESYWAKWKPKCKAHHDQKINNGETKMIRTEEDYNRRKTCCESEQNLPLRCPDCFKCIPNDKDVKCLHKRAATKESKSSDFVKSEFDDAEPPIEDNYNTARTESKTNGCHCPKSCPGNVEMASTEPYNQEGSETSPVTRQKQLDEEHLDKNQRESHKNEVGINSKSDKNEIDVTVAKSQAQDVSAKKPIKSKTSASDTSGSCHNPRCPYVRHAHYRTAVTLEGQDVEEQLKITQYSNKLVEKSAVNKGVNAEEPFIKGDTHKDNKNIPPTTRPIKTLPNDPTGDSKIPGTVKPSTDQSLRADSPSIPTGPEGAEMPVSLQHTDSFILNSIKHISSEGKPHYKQPTTIKLSTTPKVKGHSYPLKPILKKEKAHTPRKTLHSPKKPMAANTKSLKPTYKKKF